MSNLQPYTKYRNSGEAWLGLVPVHWSLKSLGAVSVRRSERNRPDLPLLSVLRERGVVLRSALSKEENHNIIPDDLSNYRVARAGNLVVNKMKAWQGSVGIAPTDGIVSPAYFIFELSNIKPEFAHRLLRSRIYVDFFARSSDGIRTGQWDLDADQMKRIPVIIPPEEEQEDIVRYLDIVDRSIRSYIRNRRRLIGVLNEQKQAIINRAVIRGLEPDVPLKFSGIESFGDIPEHWDVKPAKLYLAEVDERSETGEEELLSVSHITGVTPRSQKNITMFMAASYVGHKICRPGDLVINTMWAWMGALGVAFQTGIVSPSYAVYRPRNFDIIVPEYLDHLLRIEPYRTEYLCRSTGIRMSRMRLYPEQFLSSTLYKSSEKKEGR
jgi:type I restriction enzyme, S subunit